MTAPREAAGFGQSPGAGAPLWEPPAFNCNSTSRFRQNKNVVYDVSKTSLLTIYSYMTMPFRERHQREMKQGWCFRNRV